MKRAVLLGRVSRDEGQDPENQLGPLRDMAARLEVEVAKEVKFEGKSAWDDRQAREVWTAIRAAMIETRADTLMVWALDRVTRQGIQDAMAKIWELEEHFGADFYSYTEPFLSTATAHPLARDQILSMMAWSAEQESARKSERLLAKVEQKKRDAGKLGQRALLGRGRMPLDADKARMVELRAEGRPLREIAKLTGFGQGTVHRTLQAARSNPPVQAGGIGTKVGAEASEPGGGPAP